jgi:hypothetical protein
MCRWPGYVNASRRCSRHCRSRRGMADRSCCGVRARPDQLLAAGSTPSAGRELPRSQHTPVPEASNLGSPASRYPRRAWRTWARPAQLVPGASLESISRLDVGVALLGRHLFTNGGDHDDGRHAGSGTRTSMAVSALARCRASGRGVASVLADSQAAECGRSLFACQVVAVCRAPQASNEEPLARRRMADAGHICMIWLTAQLKLVARPRGREGDPQRLLCVGQTTNNSTASPCV